MPALGTVIAGILGGGALIGGALVAIDPLGARTVAGNGEGDNGGGETFDDDAEAPRPQDALAVLGYAPTGSVTPQDVRNFQSDVNEVLLWVRATKAGEQRVPPHAAGFLEIPLLLQGIPAASGLDVNGNLDPMTLAALGTVLEQATLTSGVACTTPQGQAVESSMAACQQVWREAHRYAYEANLNSGPQPPIQTSTFQIS